MKRKGLDPIPSNIPRAAGIYLSVIVIGNLVWETLQLPLYAIWQDGTVLQQAIAVTHCTVGDVLIASTSLGLALLTVGSRDWPVRYFARVALVATVAGLGYTVFSEWQNVNVLGSWSYSQLMPIIAVGDAQIGVSPLLQWIVLPPASFLLMRNYLPTGSCSNGRTG